MRHQNDNNTRPASKQEIQLKNKILNQNRRAKTEQVNNKRRREESDSEEEEEKPKTVKSKKKIGTQGDFLSMYLTEREKKKKKKK